MIQRHLYIGVGLTLHSYGIRLDGELCRLFVERAREAVRKS